MGKAMDFTRGGNRLPKNELEKLRRENMMMFQTVINGNIQMPAGFSMDDGFVGLQKKSPAKLCRARSGSSIQLDRDRSSVSLGEASTQIHERKRKQWEPFQTSHVVTDNEATTLSEEENDPTSRTNTSQPPYRFRFRKERPCLSFLRLLFGCRCGWSRQRSPSSTFLLINQMNQLPLPTIKEDQPMRDARKRNKRSPLCQCLLCCSKGGANDAPATSS